MKRKHYATVFFVLLVGAFTFLTFRETNLEVVQAQSSMVDPASYTWGHPWPWGPSGNWRITFSDEFNSNQLNMTKWNNQWGAPGAYWGPPNTVSWSQEIMYPENVIMRGQHVAIQHQVRNGEITSGVITTNGKFSQRHGFFEAKMQMCWWWGTLNAFWLQYDPNHWPPEIDIVEFLTLNVPGDGVNDDVPGVQIPYATIHYGYPGHAAAGHHRDMGVNYALNFHVFGLEWNPQELIWYIDGVEYWRVANPGGDFDAHPMYLQFNIHSGHMWGPHHNFPNMNDETPCYMNVDYVRVYERLP